MPPNRIVALLSPLVALAAGAAATWLADNVGLEISAGQLEAVFIAGIAAVLAPAAQWLHGYQQYERHAEEMDRRALEADAQAGALAAEPELVEEEDFGEYDTDDEDEWVGDDEQDAEDYASARDEGEQPVPVDG